MRKEDMLRFMMKEMQEVKLTVAGTRAPECGFCYTTDHTSSTCYLAMEEDEVLNNEEVYWAQGQSVGGYGYSYNQSNNFDINTYHPGMNHQNLSWGNNNQPKKLSLEDAMSYLDQIMAESRAQNNQRTNPSPQQQHAPQIQVPNNQPKKMSLEDAMSNLAQTMAVSRAWNDQRFDALEASQKRMDVQIEQPAEAVQKYERRDVEEHEKKEDSTGDLETNDYLLPFIMSNTEPHESLCSLEINLPLIELKENIYDTLDPLLGDVPNTMNKLGSFDILGSSFFNFDNEYYFIEFDNSHVYNTCFQVIEELEALGHGAKDVKWKFKNDEKHGPDTFPFDNG